MRSLLSRFVVAAWAATAAGGLAVATPVSAGGVATDGYVWAYAPTTPNYIANSGYEHNSTGGVVEVTRVGVGDYRVRFAGMGGSGGVAHAQAYGGTGICTVVNWQHGVDVTVTVHCFDAGGVPADRRFVAHFTDRAVPGGHFAYLWANQPGTAGPYQPSAAYAYDSTGVPTQIQRVAVGRYLVYVGAVTDLYPDVAAIDGGHLQVSAYNAGPVQCMIRPGDYEDPMPLSVWCYDPTGAYVDSRFTVSYAAEVGVTGLVAGWADAYVRNNVALPPWVQGWWGTGAAPTVTRTSTGRYRVRFPGAATPFGYALVNTQDVTGTYCAVWSWYPDPGTTDELVNVGCTDPVTHTPADQDFGVAFGP